MVMVTHPGQFGTGMMRFVKKKQPLYPVKGMGPDEPRRRFHTAARPRVAPPPASAGQRRGLKLQAAKAAEFVKQV